MDFAGLRLFVSVAEQGSVSRAAKLLRMQQPTLSRAVSAFESECGAQLFSRQARGVTLTEAGRRLFQQCAPLCLELAQRASDALQAPDTLRGVIAFGLAEVLAHTTLPEVARELQREHPELSPYALVAPSDVLVESVRSGALLFALVMHARRAPGLVAREITSVRHHLVIAKKHARDANVRRRFIGSREVEDPGNRHFPTLDGWRKHEPKTVLAASTNSLSAHRAMVLAGVGISILPEPLIAADLRAKRLVALLHGDFSVLCLSSTQTVWSAAAKVCLDTWIRVAERDARG